MATPDTESKPCLQDQEAVQETDYLLAVTGMRDAIKAGMSESLAESSKSLDWDTEA